MAVADAPFDLIDVKLAAPVARPGTVAKADAIASLAAATSRTVTVIAPAGYGKTTLLAAWADVDPRPFAWVALDGQHDDPLVLLRYVVGAIHRVEPLAPEVFDGLAGPGGSTWTTHVPRVGSALRGLSQPFVLVLDDLHAIANPACLDVLAELFEHVPAGSQIAIASREEPAWPMGRWRAKGLTTEVGVADLRLDPEEAGLLLEAAGVSLTASEIAELTERTEGWPAGLYLAALSLRAGAPAATEFTGDDRFVAEYFRDELLSRLPPAEAQFLKHTSVLRRLTADLCDAVLKTTGSADTLAELERTNGFVVPLDRHGEWYRYHHLFGELLRNELVRSEPELTAELNRRAMAWCITHGLHEAAIPYARAAGETETLAGLIDEIALPLHYDGRMSAVEEWLSWFDDKGLVQHPALAIYGAWFRALTGRPAEAERWLALAENSTAATDMPDGSATIAPWVATLRAAMMARGAEHALADAELALEQLPADSQWAPVARLCRGLARLLLGDTDRAKADLMESLETGLAVGAIEDVFVTRAQLALLAARQGAWTEAREQADAARAAVDSAGLGDYSTSAIVHVAAARVLLHDARVEEARASLTSAHRLRPLLDHGLPWLTVQVGLELARAHLTLAEASAARTVLEETERVLELRPDLGVLIEDARELRERVVATSGPAGTWAMSLTAAELRLLPYLATHLTFPEIASRLFISRNTVKSEAVAIYRKFGASSRSEAIERAVEVGLLESSLFPPRANLTPDG